MAYVDVAVAAACGLQYIIIVAAWMLSKRKRKRRRKFWINLGYDCETSVEHIIRCLTSCWRRICSHFRISCKLIFWLFKSSPLQHYNCIVGVVNLYSCNVIGCSQGKEHRLSQEVSGISKSGQFLPLWSYIGPELPTGWCGIEHWLKLVSVQVIWTSVEDEFGRVVLSNVWSSRLVKSSEWFWW